MRTCLFGNFIGSTCTIISLLIITLLVYFVGYKNRVEWNLRLIETVCENSNSEIIKARCSYECNCYPICSGSGTTRTCHQSCSTCYRDCYQCYCSFWYDAKGTNHTIRKKIDTITKHESAVAYMNEHCEIGKVWRCYYDSAAPGDGVVTEYYNEKAWLRASIAFLIMTGIAASWFIIVLGIWLYETFIQGVLLSWRVARNPEPVVRRPLPPRSTRPRSRRTSCRPAPVTVSDSYSSPEPTQPKRGFWAELTENPFK